MAEYPLLADDDIEVNVGPEETVVSVGGALMRTLPDGTIEVDFEGGFSEPGEGADEHNANLAEHVSEGDLRQIAEDILEYVEIDKKAREEWQQKLGRGLEILGLREVPDSDQPFEGASSVTYPLLAEACVQFQARAMEELFPPAGPVKITELGKVPDEYAQRRRRVEQHMNYQMTDEDRAYYWETDQMLWFLPLVGSAFRKCYYSPTEGTLKGPFVRSEDLFVPYIAASLEDAPRYTHRYYKVTNDVRKAMQIGEFRDVELGDADSHGLDEEDDEARIVIDEAQGRSRSVHEDDDLRTLYECHLDLDLPGFEDEDDDTGEPTGIKLPYVVTVDEDSRQVLSIRRNWREGDPLKRKRIWFIHYKYLPGHGFYGYGLLHLIGGLAEAATGTLRAFLDSAAFATMQGGFMSRDASMKAGHYVLEPGKYHQTNLTADELNSAFYTPPFKEPSPAMGQVFQILIDAGRRFASTTEAMVGDADNTGPVGTTVAMIEQGSKVFSGIHKRLHQAQREEFALRYELNSEYVPEEGYPFAVEGDEQMVYRADYDAKLDIIPVSDPNIFSSTQRIALAQTTLQLADSAPDLYDRKAAHKRMLEALRVPQAEELLPNQDDLEPHDPVTENMLIMTQRPVQVFPEQNHEAHIQVHMQFLEHPGFGGNQQAQQLIMQQMLAHLAEHVAYLYQQRMMEAGVAPRDVDLMADRGESPTQDGMTPEMEDRLALMAASVGQQFLESRGLPPEQGGPGPDPEKQMEMQQEQQAWEADQQRKQAEWEAAEARKDEEFANEQRRKDYEAMADLERQMEKMRAEMALKEEQAEIEAQTRAIERLEKMAEERRQSVERRTQEAADARQRREQAEADAQQRRQQQAEQTQDRQQQGGQGNRQRTQQATGRGGQTSQ